MVCSTVSELISSSSIMNSHLCVTESGADSGLGSGCSSRSSSASVGQGKKRYLKQTWSLGLELDEGVADLNDVSKSQPNLHSVSHKAEQGHKEGLLHDQVFSKLTSKVSTCHVISL